MSRIIWFAIHERTHIEKRGDQTEYTEDDGQTWTVIPEGSLVSMNMWGFSASILKELKERFPVFLKKSVGESDEMRIFPAGVVSNLLSEGKATVEVQITGQMVWRYL